MKFILVIVLVLGLGYFHVSGMSGHFFEDNSFKAGLARVLTSFNKSTCTAEIVGYKTSYYNFIDQPIVFITKDEKTYVVQKFDGKWESSTDNTKLGIYPIYDKTMSASIVGEAAIAYCTKDNK